MAAAFDDTLQQVRARLVVALGRTPPGIPDLDTLLGSLRRDHEALVAELHRVQDEQEAVVQDRTATLTRRSHLLEAVRAITSEIAGELHLSEVLGLITRRAVTLLGGMAGDVYLWHDDTEELVPAAWVNEGDYMRDVRVRLGEHLAGRVAAQRQGIIVNDYQTRPEANPVLRAEGKVAAAVMEPLLYRDRLVGVITVDRDAAGGPFTPEDQRALQLLAGHAAIAIENARLYGAAQRELAERARAEETLQRYHLVAEQARDIILFVRRRDGQILEANRTAVDRYGYAHSELLQRTIQDLRAPATRPLTDAQLAQADSEAGILFETVHSRKDGTLFPVEVSSRGATLAGERVLLSLVRDVTDRQRAEAAVRLSEEKFTKAFAANPAAMSLTRVADGRILEVNDSCLTLLGYRREELIGRSTLELRIWRDPEARSRYVEQLRHHGQLRHAEVQLAQKSGEPIDVLLSTELITIGGDEVMLATFLDISARKQAEAAVQSVARFPDENPDPVLRVTRDGTLVYANRASDSLLRYWDCHVGQRLPPDWCARVAAAYSGGVVREVEVTCADGRVYACMLTPILNAEYLNIYTRDITARTQAEEALRQLNATLEQRVEERTVALSDALGQIAAQSEQLRTLASELTVTEQRERWRLAELLHEELQQQLVAAKYRVDLIARSSGPEVQAGCRDLAALIGRAVEYTRSLSQDLCPPILQMSGIVRAIESLAQSMKEQYGLEVTLQVSGGGALDIEEDLRVLLYQAVRETLFNCVKHARVAAATVEVEGGHGRASVVVSDRGVGFDAAQALLGGTGRNWGLVNLRQRLELLGGALDIASTPGQGTRIAMSVPLRPPTTEQG